MSTGQAVAFLLFALAAAGTPGPSNLLLTTTGAAVGVRRGLPALFGVTVGMGFMLFAVAFGLGSVLLDHPAVLELLKWVGVGFLLWLAWKIATAGRLDAHPGTRAIGFWGAAAFQWVNPKSWLVAASAAGTYLESGRESAFAQSLAFGGLFVLAALPACAPWLAFGAWLQRLLRSERAARVCNLLMAALLAGSILLIV